MSDKIENIKIPANRDLIIATAKQIHALKTQRAGINKEIGSKYDAMDTIMSRAAFKMFEKALTMNHDEQQDLFADMISLETIIDDVMKALSTNEPDEDEDQDEAA